MSLETETYKGHEIKIVSDLNSESPREWENICIIHTAHRNYSIGDEHHTTLESIKGAEREAKQNGDLVFPLYLYEHGGITISLGEFSCPWDSGQVGFVQVPRKKMMEEFGKKIFTSPLKAKGRKHAEAEVDTLDKFIRGDVCGFDVDDGEESCYGFYSIEDAMSEAKGVVDWMIKDAEEKHCKQIKDAKEKHCKQLKIWIKNKVPFEYRTALEV